MLACLSRCQASYILPHKEKGWMDYGVLLVGPCQWSQATCERCFPACYPAATPTARHVRLEKPKGDWGSMTGMICQDRPTGPAAADTLWAAAGGGSVCLVPPSALRLHCPSTSAYGGKCLKRPLSLTVLSG